MPLTTPIINAQGRKRSAVNPLAASHSGNGSSAPQDPRLQAIQGLQQAGHNRAYRKGATLFLEGDSPRGLFLVTAGQAKVSICSADGRKVIMRIAGPQSILGLYAALTGRPYEATAEMVEAGCVTFVPRRDLLELIAYHPWFGRSLVEVFTSQFSELIDHARLRLLSESALERLARLILKWGRDFGELTSGGVRLKILLTQEEIAQIIGASRETVTRLFSALKRRQIIGVHGNELIIRNSDALASVAGSS
jgi:CRP/FNR family transcriptional regulator, cyclic AMP receptor protein